MKYIKLINIFCLSIMLSLYACGGSDTEKAEDGSGQTNGLTAFEMEHGIGPITEPVTIGELDMDMAKRGFETYDMKCAACHRMENRFVGPPLGEVVETRSPEFIMNFILNPEENIRRHPVGQELLREYLVEMTYQNISETEAREILEYLRYVNQTGEEIL